MQSAARVRERVSTRPKAQDIDRHVGARLRERRLTLGMTQQQIAELIGVTYQQAYKYEKGINRIASGRLPGIAKALGVDVSYFFVGLDSKVDTAHPTPRQRLLLELTRNFLHISNRRQQEAICVLVRTLVPDEVRDDPALEQPYPAPASAMASV